jgi:hypothetical protein
MEELCELLDKFDELGGRLNNFSPAELERRQQRIEDKVKEEKRAYYKQEIAAGRIPPVPPTPPMILKYYGDQYWFDKHFKI